MAANEKTGDRLPEPTNFFRSGRCLDLHIDFGDRTTASLALSRWSWKRGCHCEIWQIPLVVDPVLPVPMYLFQARTTGDRPSHSGPFGARMPDSKIVSCGNIQRVAGLGAALVEVPISRRAWTPAVRN
jgi:hypothetical protein